MHAPHTEHTLGRLPQWSLVASLGYVTLEPCNHHGRTPPCVDAILAARLERVVIGCCDPNPHVTGGGVARLRLHGVEVSVGVLAHEARWLIEEWARHLGGQRDGGAGQTARRQVTRSTSDRSSSFHRRHMAAVRAWLR